MVGIKLTKVNTFTSVEFSKYSPQHCRPTVSVRKNVLWPWILIIHSVFAILQGALFIYCNGTLLVIDLREATLGLTHCCRHIDKAAT
jgi:hypothetical protein